MAPTAIAEHLARDLTLAWRNLRRSPGFATIVVLTIAIGIGVNAAVLGIIDTGFLRKLPVPNPERVVLIVCADTVTRRADVGPCSFPEFRDLRARRVEGLESLAAYAMAEFKLGGEHAGLAPGGSF